MDRVSFGFKEGLTVSEKGGPTHLFYDMSQDILMSVSTTASEIVIHTKQRFQFTHIQLIPVVGQSSVIPITKIDDFTFSFAVPDCSGDFMFLPD